MDTWVLKGSLLSRPTHLVEDPASQGSKTSRVLPEDSVTNTGTRIQGPETLSEEAFGAIWASGRTLPCAHD